MKNLMTTFKYIVAIICVIVLTLGSLGDLNVITRAAEEIKERAEATDSQELTAEGELTDSAKNEAMSDQAAGETGSSSGQEEQTITPATLPAPMIDQSAEVPAAQNKNSSESAADSQPAVQPEAAGFQPEVQNGSGESLPEEQTGSGESQPTSAPETTPETQPESVSDSAAAAETVPTEVPGVSATDLVQTKDLIASDGRTYRVTVFYKSDSGIPEGAELSVREVLNAKAIEAAMTEEEKAAQKPEDQKTEEEKKADAQDEHYADYFYKALEASNETKKDEEKVKGFSFT
ncbi:MAG: hypothetical protein IKF90_17035, partial [Parasporobacterium sp.]|nr:hypothetical protein [Parasporobacterium sp.]